MRVWLLLGLRDKISQITQSQHMAVQKDKTHGTSTGPAQGYSDCITPDTNTNPYHTHKYTADTEYQQIIKQKDSSYGTLRLVSTIQHSPNSFSDLPYSRQYRGPDVQGGSFFLSQG